MPSYGHYTANTQSIQANTQSIHGQYAVDTQSLHGRYAVNTNSIRSQMHLLAQHHTVLRYRQSAMHRYWSHNIHKLITTHRITRQGARVGQCIWATANTCTHTQPEI